MNSTKAFFRPGQIVLHQDFGLLRVVRVFEGGCIEVEWAEQDSDTGEYSSEGPGVLVSGEDLTLADYNFKVSQLVRHDLFSGLFRIVEIVIPSNMLKVEGVYKSQETGEYISNGSSRFLYARDCERVEES